MECIRYMLPPASSGQSSPSQSTGQPSPSQISEPFPSFGLGVGSTGGATIRVAKLKSTKVYENPRKS